MLNSHLLKTQAAFCSQPWEQGEEQPISNFRQGVAKIKLEQLTTDTLGEFGGTWTKDPDSVLKLMRR